MSRFDKSVYMLCLVCFFATLLIHLGTFLVPALRSTAPFVPFHVLAIASGLFVTLRYRNAPDSFPKWTAPERMRIPLYVLFAYSLLTMAFMWNYFEAGSPTVIDGKPQLSNHGEFIRYLTDDEYAYAQRYELRFLSCGWMAVFAGIAAYLAQLREANSARMPK